MAKCQFCETSNETVKERISGLVLCNECSEARDSKLAETKMEEEKEMDKNKSKVVDIKEYEEVEEKIVDEETTAEVNDTKCEIIIGVKENGSLYFNAGGNSPDLLVIDGLLNFGKRRLKQIWEQRDVMQRAQMEAAAQEEQADKE